MMSGTKMIGLWFLLVFGLAAIFCFISGWMSDRKQRKENPAGPRRTCKEQVAGFFLIGCFYVVMTIYSDDILMRVLYGVETIGWFLAAVVLQKRVQRKMPDRPVEGVVSAELHRPI